MRRMLGFLCTSLVLAATLALPAVAAAKTASDPYTYAVLKNSCPQGDVLFKVKLRAAGWSEANRLTIDSKSQIQYGSYGRWHNLHTWARVGLTWVPDGTAHSLALQRRQDHLYDNKDFNSYRIVFKLKAWDHGLVAWSQTVRSVECVG
jgi:hypothetical protein